MLTLERESFEINHKYRLEAAGMVKFECVDGMRHTDLRPIVKHQQRAICTATKAEMRDSHTGGPRGEEGHRDLVSVEKKTKL